MQWTQGYAPLGEICFYRQLARSCRLSSFWALAVKRMKGYIAGLLTLAVSLLIAVFVYGMLERKSGDVRFSGSGVRAASDRLDYRHIGLSV
ncbi:hypothetical protein ACSE3M_06865 [Bacillus velezensis]